MEAKQKMLKKLCVAHRSAATTMVIVIVFKETVKREASLQRLSTLQSLILLHN